MAVAYCRGRASPHAPGAEPDDAPAPAPAPARAAASRAGRRACGRPSGAMAAVTLPRALVAARGIRALVTRAGARPRARRESAPDAGDDAPRLGAGLPVLRR